MQFGVWTPMTTKLLNTNEMGAVGVAVIGGVVAVFYFRSEAKVVKQSEGMCSKILAD